MEAESRPLDGADLPTLLAGRGGDGWHDDDSGEDWGWSDHPAGDEDGPPYRRSRIMRVVALATVAAVVAGSIGTWVVFLAVGSSQPSFAVSSIRASAPATQPATTSSPSALVTFVLSNQSSRGGSATCRVTLATRDTTVGSRAVRLPTMPGGGTATVSVRVPLNPGALPGHGAASGRVTCVPTSRTTG